MVYVEIYGFFIRALYNFIKIEKFANDQINLIFYNKKQKNT